MDEHLADSDAIDYDMDRADGEWALSDYVQKGIGVLDNDTGFFMMCEGGKIDCVLVKLFGNTLFGNYAPYRTSIGVI